MPDSTDDDRQFAALDVLNAAVGDVIASDCVPVPMFPIALQGLHVFRGASREEAAELGDSEPDITYQRYEKEYCGVTR